MRDMPLLIGVEGRYPQEDPATKGHCEVNGKPAGPALSNQSHHGHQQFSGLHSGLSPSPAQDEDTDSPRQRAALERGLVRC